MKNKIAKTIGMIALLLLVSGVLVTNGFFKAQANAIDGFSKAAGFAKEAAVIIPEGTSFKPNDSFTVEGFVKFPNIPELSKVGPLVCRKAGQLYSQYFPFCVIASKTYDQSRFYLQALVSVVNLPTAQYQLSGVERPFAAGAWHHFALTVDSQFGLMKFFLDGQVVAWKNIGAPLTFDTDHGMTMGAAVHKWPVGFEVYTDALLDEVRVSNNVRYDVNFIAPQAPFVSDSSTVNLYHFDNDLLDSSTNGNHGYPFRTIWFEDH